jgi:PAS domain-containing protein
MSTSDPLKRPAEAPPPVESDHGEGLRFERYLSNLAPRFQRLPADQLDQAITDSLRELTETLDMDRCSTLELSEDGSSLQVAHGYARPGAQAPEFGVELATLLPWYTEQVRRGRALVLSRMPDALPEEARAERAYVVRIGMRSHVILPLVVDREIVGCLGIGAFHEHRDFPPDFISRLELVASVFASALYRRRAEAKLHEARDLNQAVLASVASEIVVLDREGRIVAVNRAWETSARRERVPLSSVHPGADYFEMLAQASHEGAAPAAGIRSVFSGEKDRFEVAYEYPHSTGTLHYLLCATRLTGAAGGAVVVQTDVTTLERAKLGLERALSQVSELKERLQAENVVLQEEIRRSGEFEEIVGRSPALAVLLQQVRQVAETEAPVLVLGETGTGKDLVARAVHDRSPMGAVHHVNCGAPAAHRERALRLREGGIHRRPHPDPRPLRGGGRGHALPRRSRRAAARGAGQAVARLADRRFRAARLL